MRGGRGRCGGYKREKEGYGTKGVEAGGQAMHLYHKHVLQHGAGAGGKPKEQLEAEAAAAMRAGFPWPAEQHHYGNKSRNYADCMIAGPGAMDLMAYG